MSWIQNLQIKVLFFIIIIIIIIIIIYQYSPHINIQVVTSVLTTILNVTFCTVHAVADLERWGVAPSTPIFSNAYRPSHGELTATARLSNILPASMSWSECSWYWCTHTLHVVCVHVCNRGVSHILPYTSPLPPSICEGCSLPLVLAMHSVYGMVLQSDTEMAFLKHNQNTFAQYSFPRCTAGKCWKLL